MDSRKLFSRGGLLLALLYVCCHALLLIDRGIYWDDWVLYRMPVNVVYINLNNAGTTPFAWLHVLLSRPQNPVFMTNVLTFVAYLISGLLVWRILRRVRGLSATEAWCLAALQLALPLNMTRNVMMNDQYSVCQLLFWVAAALFQANEQRPRRSVAVAALSAVLFFGAFLTQSYLVAFLWVLALALWQRQPRTLADAGRMALKLAPWLLLPVAFWVVKSIYFKPAGWHAASGYHEIKLENIVALPVNLVRTFYFSFVKILLVMALALRSWLAALVGVGVGRAGAVAEPRVVAAGR